MGLHGLKELWILSKTALAEGVECLPFIFVVRVPIRDWLEKMQVT